MGYVRCAEHDIFPTGEHFNLPGHTENNMKVFVIEKYRIESSNNRKTREAQFINLFDTKRKNLIKKCNCQILTYKFAFFILIFVICIYVSLTYN